MPLMYGLRCVRRVGPTLRRARTTSSCRDGRMQVAHWPRRGLTLGLTIVVAWPYDFATNDELMTFKGET